MAGRLFIGVGNPFRRDDGVGPWLANALTAHGLRAVAHPGDGAGLIDWFQTEPDIVLLDATRSGQPPGTVTQLDALAGRIPAEMFHYSTHRFGVAEAVETARALGMLPRRLMLFGIEGADFAAGEGLSAPVAAAANRLLAQLFADAPTVESPEISV